MTLYELLGALPNDDAEGLRTAFRRAVKGAHPDIRPGDPDAAWNFRRIVRAHEILGDAEQRAAYDHLLDLAHIEAASANGHATAARIHKLASGVIALAAASVVTVGGYVLFMHMSSAMVAPADRPAMHASASVDPAPPPVTTGKGASLAKDEGAGIPAEAGGPDTDVPKANAGNIPAAKVGPALDLATRDARPSRARSALTHRNGNPNRAVAAPNQASLLDPNMTAARNDRGIMFHRLRRFERAFADIAPTNRVENQIEKPVRVKPASATAAAPRLGPAAVARPVIPVPRPRMMAQDPSRQESMTAVLH
ncbi:DnaJ domain-containing protein [Bradyrhizobium sediminis]|uniref:DnaJ domain-containing protein n=1 Tax=Bradyrhizobium sediminis TaxID=2840469 RepID=A0A975NQF6_9BRAD|nr:DnaJ domain-containing protein [Bradyrhizobium sediminis]QWG19357.1 DnaJ domain-containing protein [Bradyrhizobium sediminis]